MRACLWGRCWLICVWIALGCGEAKMPDGPAGAVAGSSDRDASASGSANDTCSATMKSLSADIFVPYCATSGCHTGARAAGGLDLSGASPETKLVLLPSGTCDGELLVRPGDAAGSLLYKKLTGNLSAACGDPMPPGKPLPDALKKCVGDWISGLDADASVPAQTTCETCGTSMCIDTSSNANHCGMCGKMCPSGAACVGGQCSCPMGLTLCGSECVDVTRNAAHCGSCNKSCGSTSSCSAGACVCAAGLTACGSTCTELSSDPNHCGNCTTACGPGKLCTPTGCSTGGTCSGGLTKCGQACINTTSSFFNCGGCGITCAAGESCNSGVCGCGAGEKLCGGTCLSVMNDASNCGNCGIVCPNGTTCTNGACACPGGGSACGNACVDLQSDPKNCGACGKSCAPGQACSAGKCACGSTSASFATVAALLDTGCTNVGCHEGTRPKEGLNLTPSVSYAELVSVKAQQCSDGRLLVKPGSPESSYLLQKMLGIDMCSGSQMPKAGANIPQQDLEAISAWICAGAPK